MNFETISFADALRLLEKTTQILDTLPQCVFQKDTQGKFTYVNSALCRALGEEDPTKVMGESDYQFFEKEVADKYRLNDLEMLDKYRHTGKIGPEVFEEPFRPLRGLHAFVQTTKIVCVDQAGRVVGVRGILWDIANELSVKKRLKEEKELWEQEARLRTAEVQGIIDNCPVAIYRHKLDQDAGYSFFDANGKVQDICGYSPDEFKTLTVYDLVTPDIKDVVTQRIEEKISAGPGSSIDTFYEVTLRHKDPKVGVKRIEVSSRMIWRGDEPLWVLGVARDVTTERLEEMRFRERIVLSTTGGATVYVTQTMCHDFKNPMTIVDLLALNLINAATKNGDLSKYQEQLLRIRHQVGQTVEKINEYLNRLHGEMKFGRTPYEFIRLFLEFLSYMKRELISPQLGSGEIAYSVSPGVPPGIMIGVDRYFVWSVFLNIMRNAIEAILAKRQLNRSYSGAVLISSYVKGEQVCLDFEDDGDGMSNESMERLNCTNELVRSQKGEYYGAGTAIIRQVMGLHGGTVLFTQSESLGGLKVALTFPKHEKNTNC